MRAILRAALAVLSITGLARPALADILIDNVAGLTPDGKGGVATFSAILIGDDGRIEQVYTRGDKQPGKVDYRLDGKGRVMIPGLIDSHVHLMDMGLALLKAKAGFKGTPMGEPRPEDRDLAFAEAQDLMIRQGITTVADMGTTIADWQTYRRAGDLGALRLRIVSYAASPADMLLIGGPGPSPWLYADRLKHNGLYLALDGSLADREAWLKAPYADSAKAASKKSSGDARLTAIQLRNLMSRGAIDNFQVAISAHGDEAVASALDALDELKETYIGERRWRIEALELTDAADVPRLAAHGVMASFQPGALLPLMEHGADLLGPERLPDVERWRSIAEAGVPLAFGSGTRGAAPRPFADMALAISRRAADSMAFGGWQAQEAVTRQDALTAWTAAGARALFAEGRLGRIAQGLRADFLLIDRDPLLAAPDQLGETHVLEVWIGGQLAWKPEAAEGLPAIGR